MKKVGYKPKTKVKTGGNKVKIGIRKRPSTTYKKARYTA